jgi:hypothetical protein
MVSFSQPQRLATDRSAAAKTLKNPSWYQGLSVGIPSAVAGLPSDLFAIAQDDAMVKALQGLGILGPTKQDVVDRVVNTGLLNIDDQEAFNLGTGLASDLLAPGLPFAPSGAARAARAIDNVVSLSPEEKISKQITGLLKSGRADEVTDEMLANADAPYLLKKYDLPMDAESRMARGREMGFDVDNPVYHGTHSKDIKAFDDKRIGATDDGFFGRGHYFTPYSGEARYYGPNVGKYNLKGNFLDLTNRVGDGTLGDPEYFKWWANELDKIDMLDEPTTKGLKAMRELDTYVDNNITYAKFDNNDGTTGYMAQIVDPTREPDVFKGKTYYPTIDTYIKPHADQQVPLTKKEAKQNAMHRFIDEMQWKRNHPFKDIDNILYSLSDYIRVGGKGAAELTKKASEAGYDGIKVGDETVIFKPKNIRSSESRFDPRLQSLDNLNASVVMPSASPGMFNGLLTNQQLS